MSWGGPKIDRGDVKIDLNDKGSDQSWKKNVDTHKMTSEQVKAAGVEASQRPPGHGHGAGEVLHQRGRLPYNYATMAIAGLAIAGIIGYGVLYSKKKAGVDAIDVAKVATNTARPENTESRSKR